MKKAKFSEARIVAVLRECATGTTIGEVARKVGVSEQTLYTWKKCAAPSGPRADHVLDAVSSIRRQSAQQRQSRSSHQETRTPASDKCLGLPGHSADGRVSRKTLPRPRSLSTSTFPPSDVTMLWQIASPRPVPSPAGFVV